MQDAIRMDIMLHAYMLTQSGIPMLYSGDEVGRVNDYTYKQEPGKAADSRYIHRGRFNWELAEACDDVKTVSGQIFRALGQLETLRKKEKVFDADADCQVLDAGDDALLCLMRCKGKERMIGLFNFHDMERQAVLAQEGVWKDMLSGKVQDVRAVTLPGHGFVWLKMQ